MNTTRLRKKYLKLLKKPRLTQQELKDCSDFLRIYGNLHKPKKEVN